MLFRSTARPEGRVTIVRLRRSADYTTTHIALSLRLLAHLSQVYI
jgi:hypothetical protein